MSLTRPRFHTLRVADLRRETPDAVSLTFAIPPALADDYRFDAGQYLTLRATLGDEDVRRSYSICSGPDDGELRIAVKRLAGGRFSTWVNESLRPGMPVEVMTPTGRFGLPDAPGRVATYGAFVAGSGITPVLSIVRGILAREPASRVFLFYGNRSVGEILFREALEELKDRHLGRLSVFHVLSQEEQDIPILHGRLDARRARIVLQRIVPAASLDHVFLCGPHAMLEEIAPVLSELGVPGDHIHIERFVSAAGGRPAPRPAPQNATNAAPHDATNAAPHDATNAAPHDATNAAPHDAPSAHVASAHVASVLIDGNRRTIPVAAGETVLDAALRAGMDLPFACKGGMCSTCRARIVEGRTEMAVNYSLEPWELAAGFVLTCQARPLTPTVVIDYDAV